MSDIIIYHNLCSVRLSVIYVLMSLMQWWGLHKRSVGHSQQRESIQDPALPPCWSGQTGRSLSAVEMLQGDTAQGPGEERSKRTHVLQYGLKAFQWNPLQPLFISIMCSGGGWEVVHAVLHPQTHSSLHGDSPGGASLPETGRQLLAAAPEPQRSSGGGVQAQEGKNFWFSDVGSFQVRVFTPQVSNLLLLTV